MATTALGSPEDASTEGQRDTLAAKSGRYDAATKGVQHVYGNRKYDIHDEMITSDKSIHLG